MTRILIVDDHPLVRTGFAQLIGDCPDLEVCGEAGDMAEALRLIDAAEPDLAIIDLSLAGGSGLDLIERIKSRECNILMLVASMHDETLYAERVLAAGARGLDLEHWETWSPRQSPARLIRSFHDVEGVPDDLVAIRDDLRARGADLVKLVAAPRDLAAHRAGARARRGD